MEKLLQPLISIRLFDFGNLMIDNTKDVINNNNNNFRILKKNYFIYRLYFKKTKLKTIF